MKEPRLVDRYEEAMTTDETKNCFTVKSNEIKFGEVVGQGPWAKVCRATWQGNEIAIKTPLKTEQSDMLQREYNILRSFIRPNILRVLGLTTGSRGEFCLMMDFHPQTLTQYLFQQTHDVSDRVFCALGVAKGLTQLHKQHVLHLDLKTDNVLVAKDGHAVISGFGLSQKLKAGETCYTSPHIMGTASYLPPEILGSQEDEKQYTEACDVYSFGVLARTCLAKEQPYKGMRFEDIQNSVCIQNKRLEVPNAVEKEIPHPSAKASDQGLARLITGCWAASNQRPTAEKVSAELERIHGEVLQARNSTQRK